MKKLILSVLTIGLFGCGNEPKQQEVVASAPTMQNTMSNDEAKKFAENLYEKIKTEENTARTAYKNNDKTKISRVHLEQKYTKLKLRLQPDILLVQ